MLYEVITILLHHFDGFFFNRVPLLKRLKLREVAGLNFIFSRMSDKNNFRTSSNPDGLLPVTDEGTEVTKFRTMNVITSYSIHYTKLYDGSMLLFLLWDFGFENIWANILKTGWWLIRITSYNVCYTKLLRPLVLSQHDDHPTARLGDVADRLPQRPAAAVAVVTE